MEKPPNLEDGGVVEDSSFCPLRSSEDTFSCPPSVDELWRESWLDEPSEDPSLDTSIVIQRGVTQL